MLTPPCAPHRPSVQTAMARTIARGIETEAHALPGPLLLPLVAPRDPAFRFDSEHRRAERHRRETACDSVSRRFALAGTALAGSG